MEYRELGRQYLDEAAVIARRIEKLKERMKTEDMSRRTQLRLYRELSILREMHMECKITGSSLMRRVVS